MKSLKMYLSIAFISIFMLGYGCTIMAANGDKYLEGSIGIIDGVTNTGSNAIGKNVNRGIASGKGADSALARIEQFISLLMPIIIGLGIAVAFFGGYKIMASDKEDKVKEGGRLVLFGIIGIIIIVSAKFITTALVGDGAVGGILTDSTAGGVNGINVANDLYEKLVLPFMKFAIYIAAAILFFVLAGRIFSFLTSSDEGVRKKAGGMIGRSVIGILVILAAKEVVEAVFGQRNKVIDQSANDIGDIGSGIFETQNIPIIYDVINRVMALATFVVLVIIIFQTIQMLTKPDDAEIPKKIKKTLIYVAIGVIVIGAGYIISNVLLIN